MKYKFNKLEKFLESGQLIALEEFGHIFYWILNGTIVSSQEHFRSLTNITDEELLLLILRYGKDIPQDNLLT